MKKAPEALKFIKEAARPVSPQDYNYEDTINQIRSEILAGLRVGFFIEGKPFVGFLNKETNKIEVTPLLIDFGDENE